MVMAPVPGYPRSTIGATTFTATRSLPAGIARYRIPMRVLKTPMVLAGG